MEITREAPEQALHRERVLWVQKTLIQIFCWARRWCEMEKYVILCSSQSGIGVWEGAQPHPRADTPVGIRKDLL